MSAIPARHPLHTALRSALTWKTQGLPSKMFHPAPGGISMNWLVWLRAAGFRGESRRALNKFFFLKRRGTAVVAEVLSGSFNKAATAERPVAMPAMGCARGECSPCTDFSLSAASWRASPWPHCAVSLLSKAAQVSRVVFPILCHVLRHLLLMQLTYFRCTF